MMKERANSLDEPVVRRRDTLPLLRSCCFKQGAKKFKMDDGLMIACARYDIRSSDPSKHVQV
jgi:hypothetical protein